MGWSHFQLLPNPNLSGSRESLTVPSLLWGLLPGPAQPRRAPLSDQPGLPPLPSLLLLQTHKPEVRRENARLVPRRN